MESNLRDGLNSISVQPPRDLRSKMTSTSSRQGREAKSWAKYGVVRCLQRWKITEALFGSQGCHLGLQSGNFKNGTLPDCMTSPACSSVSFRTRKQITIISNPGMKLCMFDFPRSSLHQSLQTGLETQFPNFLQPQIHLTFCNIHVFSHSFFFFSF